MNIQILKPIELVDAYTCIIPSTLIYYLFTINCATVAVNLYCLSRAIYHLYNAFCDNIFIEQQIYKASVITSYLSLFMIGYQWEYKFNIMEILFYIISILFTLQSRPLEFERHRQRIHLYTVLGVLKSTYYMSEINNFVYMGSLFFASFSALHYVDGITDDFNKSKVNLYVLPAYYGLLWSVKNNILGNSK